ncbi:hypothetical protein JCM10295v2_004727 [Rhodotorula toruloides]
MVRTRLGKGYSVVVDRQNFDAGQRRTWLEIASEFPEVEVGCMVMGTSREDCRERLLVRQDHPTIDNPELAVQLLDKFSSLWEEPTLNEGFDRLITLPLLPLPAEIHAALIQSLLDNLHASPLNPYARQQRQPRPREPYRRFVDDGTWRPPPRVTYGQRGGSRVEAQAWREEEVGKGLDRVKRHTVRDRQFLTISSHSRIGAEGTRIVATMKMLPEVDTGRKERDMSGG